MKLHQFSILTLLLLVTLVALATRLWQTRAELNALMPELQQLRNEGGHLIVRDPSKFNVIQVPTETTYKWRWRVRIPDGCDCTLACIAGEIPKTGFVTQNWMFSSINVGSRTEREFVVDIYVGKTFRGLYGITASYGNQSYILLEYDDGPPPWLAGNVQYFITVAGDQKTESFPPDTRVPILRLQSVTAVGQSHGEGILVWLTTDKHDSPQKVKSEMGDK